MPEGIQLTWAMALLLHCLGRGLRYGYEVMEATGLPSGTVYPALRRLEQAGWVVSAAESERVALAEQRPARRYYKLTADGERGLGMAQERYPMLRGMAVLREAL